MKLKFKIFNVLFVVTVLFWFVYTVVFLFIDGWHWKAEEGSMEAVFDAIVGTSYTICVMLLLWLSWDVVNFLIKTADEFTKDQEEEQKEEPGNIINYEIKGEFNAMAVPAYFDVKHRYNMSGTTLDMNYKEAIEWFKSEIAKNDRPRRMVLTFDVKKGGWKSCFDEAYYPDGIILITEHTPFINQSTEAFFEQKSDLLEIPTKGKLEVYRSAIEEIKGWLFEISGFRAEGKVGYVEAIRFLTDYIDGLRGGVYLIALDAPAGCWRILNADIPLTKNDIIVAKYTTV